MSKSEQKKGIENYNNEDKSETKKRVNEKGNVSKKKSESKKKKITTVYNSENLNANVIENEDAKAISSNVNPDVSKVSEDIKTQDVEIEKTENCGIEGKNSFVTNQVVTELKTEKQEQGAQKDTKEKKEKRPSNISIGDKSELFKQIIDIALSCEKIENDKKKLKEKNKELLDENATLKDERESLKGNLEATELLCNSKQQEIDNLKSDIAHRDTVIGIVKADKDESAQEFKNALAASLRTFIVDYKELVSMEMSADVGYALAETLEGVFKILAKNGINVEN